MVIVKEESGGKDVLGSKVYLGFHQVAAAQQMVGVDVRRELLDVDIVVFQFHAIEEPRAVARDRSGKGKAGNKFVKAQSIVLAERREEVCGIQAQLVIAHAGVEGLDASCGFAEFDRITGCFGIDGTNCIRADAQSELATDWGTNIESIEQVEGRVRLRSGNMNLACPVLNNARGEGKQVADIARSRIGYVDDLWRIEGAFVGGLFYIDAGSRGNNVHLLTNHLFMSQLHFDGLAGCICLVF